MRVLQHKIDNLNNLSDMMESKIAKGLDLCKRVDTEDVEGIDLDDSEEIEETNHTETLQAVSNWTDRS